MGESSMININVDLIYPHPENPRKNLGDITELSESIKKKGVMQNLTVVEGHCGEDGWKKEGYTLLIGHRRLAAAKLAGLETVPCTVLNVPYGEQIEIMLIENMQREDLTVYEQANGFQLMLDLGQTEDSIAEKTGFSKTTVRRRLNIAKLDQKVLQEKENNESFQLTLSNLYELEKIEDIETRNKILSEATKSSDIAWKVTNAIKNKQREDVAKAIIEKLEDLGINPAPEKYSSEQYSGKWETLKEYSLDEDVPEEIKYKAKKTDTLYYYKVWNSIRIFRKAEKKPETKEERERKEKDRKKKQLKSIVKEMDNRRAEFIEGVIAGRFRLEKDSNNIFEEVWTALVEIGAYTSKSGIVEFLGKKSSYEMNDEEKIEFDKKASELTPVQQMMIVLNRGMNNVGDIVDYSGKFDKKNSDKLMVGYNILKKYGWSFGEEEETVINGTHELYVKE